jgi:hypothetical protein
MCSYPQVKRGKLLLCWVPLKKLTSVVQWFMLALSKGPNREVVVVFFQSPENANKSSFRNVLFYSYLELRTMVKVQKRQMSFIASVMYKWWCRSSNLTQEAVFLSSHSSQRNGESNVIITEKMLDSCLLHNAFWLRDCILEKRTRTKKLWGI